MKKVELDGEEQSTLTDAKLYPEEAPPLFVEKYCVAGVSLEFLND